MNKRAALKRLQGLHQALLRGLREIEGFSAYVYHPGVDRLNTPLQVHVTAHGFWALVEELGLEPCIRPLEDGSLDRASVTVGGVEVFTLLPVREEVKEAC